jgi:hypothetical protein
MDSWMAVAVIEFASVCVFAATKKTVTDIRISVRKARLFLMYDKNRKRWSGEDRFRK